MIKLTFLSITATAVSLFTFLQAQTSYEVLIGIAAFSANLIGGTLMFLMKSAYNDLKKANDKMQDEIAGIAKEVHFMRGYLKDGAESCNVKECPLFHEKKGGGR